MYGVVPKVIWNKTDPADENNRIEMAMRCLLIEDGERLILVDNGIGDKQDPKFFSHYFLHGPDTLEGSLRRHGFGLLLLPQLSHLLMIPPPLRLRHCRDITF